MENDPLPNELIDVTQKAAESQMSAYFETFSQDRLSNENLGCEDPKIYRAVR